MIIGLIGRMGSGKGTVQDYLTTKHKFYQINFADKLKHIADELSVPKNRENLQKLGEGLRNVLWDSIWIDQVDRVINHDWEPRDPSDTEGISAYPTKDTSWVIGDVRHENECAWVLAKGGLLWCIEANPGLRYERGVKRGLEKDKLSWPEFLDKSKHPTEANVDILKSRSTAIIINEGTLEELYTQIEGLIIRSPRRETGQETGSLPAA